MAIVATFSLPAQALEKPEYSVLYEDGKFEYRLYQPYIVAETEMVGMDDSSDAANEGFRRLFDYISGANSAESKVAMTAPVQQSRIDSSEKIAMTAPVQQFETETGWRVGFMLPGKYSMENAPVPSDDTRLPATNTCANHGCGAIFRALDRAKPSKTAGASAATRRGGRPDYTVELSSLRFTTRHSCPPSCDVTRSWSKFRVCRSRSVMR